MFEDVASGNCDSEGVSKSDWEPNGLDSGHSPCSLALSQTSDAQIKRALENMRVTKQKFTSTRRARSFDGGVPI